VFSPLVLALARSLFLSLSPFLHSRFPLARVLSFSLFLSLLVLPLASVLSSRSRSRSRALSLSLSSRTCVSHSRVFSPSLSFSLFLVLPPRALSLFLVRSHTRVSHSRAFSLPRSLFLSRFLSLSLLLPLVPSRSRSSLRALSLSPLFSASLSRACSLFLSLSLSCTISARSLSLSGYLTLSLVVSQGPPTSPAAPCLTLRDAYPERHRPAPSAGHRSASRRVRRATSRRSRPRGVYTPPRWEQIGSTPATIYPRVLVQLPSCAGLGVRRCNRTFRGVPCCNRSRKRPATRRKGSQRQSVEGKGGERLGPAKAKGCGRR